MPRWPGSPFDDGLSQPSPSTGSLMSTSLDVKPLPHSSIDGRFDLFSHNAGVTDDHFGDATSNDKKLTFEQGWRTDASVPHAAGALRLTLHLSMTPLYG